MEQAQRLIEPKPHDETSLPEMLTDARKEDAVKARNLLQQLLKHDNLKIGQATLNVDVV
jgi:hypothetical protein